MLFLDKFFDTMINSVSVGIWVAIGTYLANKHLIEKLEKLIKRVKS